MTQPDDPSPRPAPPPPRRPRGVWTCLLGVPVVALFLVVAAAFLPAPLLLSVWAATVSSAAVWLVVQSLVLTGIAGTMAARFRTPARMVLTGLAVLCLVGSGVITGRQLAVASATGADIDYGSVFGLIRPDVAPPETVPYTSYDGAPVSLSIWRPPDADRPTGVVVMVHGGGWVEGSSTSGLYPARADWLADSGYLVISVDYSLSGVDRHLWDVVEGQIGCALAWTAQHAAEYGGDPSRLALLGDSAGGNLVLQAALKSTAGTFTSSCGGQIPQISAVSALYPAVDPVAIYGNAGAQYFLDRYVGGSPAQYPDRYAAISPADHVVAGAPPMLITLGSDDHLVAPAPTERFVDRLQDAGVDHRLIEIPYGEHVFDWADGGIGAQTWRQATLDWFRSNGV